MKRLLVGFIAAIQLATIIVASLPAQTYAAYGDVSSTAVGDWGTNGTVYTQTIVGNNLYLGGSFSYLVNSKTGQKISANNLAAVDKNSGAPLPWHPSTNGTVFKIAHSPDNSTIYAGGVFTAADGVSRGHGAAFNAWSGALTAWNPRTNGTIRTVLTWGSAVYVGGDFTGMQNSSHLRLAQVDATTGTVNPGFVASADCRVQALATDGTNLYVGGYFTYYNGVDAPGLVRVSAASGAYDNFFNAHYIPNQPGCNPQKHHEGMAPFDMYLSGITLFVAVGGLRNYLDSLSASTGDLWWRDGADGDFQTLTQIGSWLYVGGHFDQTIWDRNGAHGGMDHIAKIDTHTGNIDTSWLPRLTPSHSPYFYGCWSTITDGLNLYAGGVFQQVSGVSHRSFAIFPGV